MVALALMNSVALASARRTGARTVSNGRTGSGTIADFAEGSFVTAIRRTIPIRSFPPVPSIAVRSHRGVYTSIVKGEQTHTDNSFVRMQGGAAYVFCLHARGVGKSGQMVVNLWYARFLPRIRSH
jgi:hypothetical protein